MALIVRIDVDRAYGKHPFWRHVLSRAASDLYFPHIDGLGYLSELAEILALLNKHQARSIIFFRRCTPPSERIATLVDAGDHQIGLHLEDSRTYETFTAERCWLEQWTGKPVRAFSKHGSGGTRFGRRHHAPYEADKYIEWGRRSEMSTFLGNLEDPELPSSRAGSLVVFPSAFWLEPHWRDTRRFDLKWLKHHAGIRDIVLLLHPENVLEDPMLTSQLIELISTIPTVLV